MAGSSDLNARRIVGFGTRNPFRFTIRPSTNEVWLGDVGWNDYEEINRIADPTSSPVANLGWPCFEGNGQQSAFAAAGLDSCASLYQTPTGLLSPYFAYAHSATVVPGETCPTGSSAIAGMAFYQGGPYPAAYDGTLFFADHSRNCIWAMHQGSNGLPDPTQVETFVAGAANPVDLETGPNGDLFYVDFDGGTIHRVVFGGSNLAPTAVIKATPSSGPSPLTVALDGTDSTDPEGRALTYSWDLDNDGTFGDSTSATPTVTFPTSGTHTVRLQVTDPSLATGTTSFDVLVDDSLPDPVIDTPAASLTWQVGQTISFSGHATDGQGAAIPASGLSWTLVLHHCPSNCHTHTVQSFNGVASGSFAAPDHDYPSYLELVLTATDSSARKTTRQRPPRSAHRRPDLPDRAGRPGGRDRHLVRDGHAVRPQGHRQLGARAQRPDPAIGRQHAIRLLVVVRRRGGRTYDPGPRFGHHLHRHLRRRRHDRLPVGPAVHRDRQRLGTGREGPQQR